MAFDLQRMFTPPSRPSWLQNTGIGIGTGAASSALVAILGGSDASLAGTALAGAFVGGFQGSQSKKDAGTVALQSAVGGGLTGAVIAVGDKLASAGEQAHIKVVGNKAIAGTESVASDIFTGL